jgi:hypothetical protein
MLNRAAFVVRPAEPYIAWAKSLDDSGLTPNADGEQTVYLVPEFGDASEAMEVLESVHAEIFARALEEWHTVEADWPKNRTFAMFKEWFRIEMHSVVEDLCLDPLKDDEQ